MNGTIILGFEEDVLVPNTYDGIREAMTLKIKDSEDWIYIWDIEEMEEGQMAIRLDIKRPNIMNLVGIDKQLDITFTEGNQVLSTSLRKTITEDPHETQLNDVSVNFSWLAYL